MRFGGHETFAIREGWLHKGLRVLSTAPEKLIAPDVADWLGVGKNMARSIRHWLVAAGLAEVEGGMSRGKMRSVAPTPLGALIWEKDPYFLDRATWWVIHAELVHNRDYAATWNWFFNRFKVARFERGVCARALRRHLEIRGGRMPTDRTLDRDVGCLLATYARRLPAPPSDPEERNESPLQELELMIHYRASGQYVINRDPKSIPWRVLGFMIARAIHGRALRSKSVTSADIRLSELSELENGPSAVCCVGVEALFEMIREAEVRSRGELSVIGLAGERSIRIPVIAPLDWLRLHFEEGALQSGKGGSNAACA